MREIESLNACFQSVMKARYIMKAARHACTHNYSCILLGYGLLPALEYTVTLNCIKGEVKAKIKISPVVVFGVLSRMVLVRGS